jgi:putative N6-adenine-specific DNA methylase
MPQPHLFFATAAKGTEGALRDELREHRFRGVRADRGGVHFEGELEDGLRACLHSRIAMRVLLSLGTFPVRGAADLYEAVRSVDFSYVLSPKHTLAVRAHGEAPGLVNTQFTAQKTKDAIVDQLRDRQGARPSVDRDDADVVVFVHLAKGSAQLYLDVAGDSLHRRGYRARIGEAPLKEPLAAAILRLSGWDRQSPLVDPMAGSGTIALEAALWARRVAPGLARPPFGIERWALWDDGRRRAAQELRDAAQAQVLTTGPEILASDLDPRMVEMAQANAQEAHVPLDVRVADVRQCQGATAPAWLVTNPPYGERLEGSDAFYRDMARAFRSLSGHTLAVFAGTPAILRALGPATKWQGLFNGNIECRLLMYAPRT